MRYEDTVFIKLYEECLEQYGTDRNCVTKDGAILSVTTEFTTNNQMQVITEGVGVYYINMYQAVFGDLRPYLEQHNNKIYKSIDWTRSAKELIDNFEGVRDEFKTDN